MVAAMGLSVCCFAYSQDANYVQGILGYFFGSTTTGKRVMTVLNRLGICTSYSSINTQNVSIAKSCTMDYKELAKTHLWIMVLDNLNFFAYVRQVIMNRTGYLENKIAGYVLFPQNADGSIPKQLQRTDIDRNAAVSLEARDLLLSDEDLQHFKSTAAVHYYRVMTKFAKEQMRRQRRYLGTDEQGLPKIMLKTPPQMPQLRVLDAKPSKLFTLPVLSFDETKVMRSPLWSPLEWA